MKEELIEAIAGMQEEEAMRLAKEMLETGADPLTVLDACREAMSVVGDRFEQKEYFLPELIIAGDMLKEIGELVKPLLQGETAKSQPLGKVLLGTVAGDIHDIGKDIVAFMLDANNIEVLDLGVDVHESVFVEKVKEVQPQVVALSGLLTLAFDQMKTTVDALVEAGVRNNVKIMIGGAAMNEEAAAYIGADAYGADATAAVNLAKGWM